MLEIQKFLRSHDPRSALRHAQEKWGIECYQDGPLVALNYSQIDSPRGVPEVEECRGLILEDLTWNVVAMPYRRFYNYSENPYAAKCNLETSVLFDKLDGSLVSIYYYDKWRAATRSRPNADGGLNKSSSTFSSLIWDTFHNQGIDLNRLSTKMTYIFELIGPDNRVVTPYEKAKLVLTGARCMTGNYEEVSFEELKQLSEHIEVPLAMSLPFKDANHIDNMVTMLPGLAEGFVLCDYGQKINGSYARVKIKSPRYLAAARLIQGFNDKRALELVLTGGADEFLSYFPEYQDRLAFVEAMLTLKCSELQHMFDKCKGASDRKAFAEIAKTSFAPWVLFTMLDGRAAGPLEALRSASVDKAAAVVFGRNVDA